MEKNNIPYYQIAKEILIKEKDLTEERANKIIDEWTFEGIENYISIEKLVESAAYGVYCALVPRNQGRNIWDSIQFKEEIFGRVETNEMTEKIKENLKKRDKKCKENNNNNKYFDYITSSAYYVMNEIHKAWVLKNADKFFKEKVDTEEQYQYLSLYFLNWEEGKKYLSFLNPIFKLLDLDLDEERLSEYFKNRTIRHVYLSRNDGVYHYYNFEHFIRYGYFTVPKGTPKDIKYLMENNVDFRLKVLMPQLKEKGFATDEELIEKLKEYDIFINKKILKERL